MQNGPNWVKTDFIKRKGLYGKLFLQIVCFVQVAYIICIVHIGQNCGIWLDFVWSDSRCLE